MYKVSEEHEMLRDLVKKFVRNELMPLEKNILDRFASGQPAALRDEENQKLFKQCKDLGLWALDVPEEAGGANLPAVALVGVNEELGYTCVPFTFPPDSPNLHMMLATVNPEQRKKYLEPYAAGETTSAIAISEPGAGGDPAGMKTRAVKDGDRLGDQRPQDLDQPHRQGRLHHRHGGDRSRAGLARRHHRLPGRQGHARAWWWRAPSRCWPASAPTRSCSRIAACHESQVLGRIGAGLRAHAASPHRAPPADGLVVHRHGAARARHAGRARQPARDLRREARRPAGHPVVGRRRRDQAACLPPDGDGRRGQAGRGPRRAHGGLDDQGLRHRDGDRDHRPRPAGVRRHGRHPGAAAVAGWRRRCAPCGFTRARRRSIAWSSRGASWAAVDSQPPAGRCFRLHGWSAK